MKSTNSKTYWRCSLGAAILSLAMPSAFAAMSDCKNSAEITLDGSVNMKFCEVPAANGIVIGNDNGYPNERHAKARDFKSFQIGQFEVTQAQYKALMGETPWRGEKFVQEGNDNPAVYVTYQEAKQFARELNRIDNTATYRLPTEAEFEYAARAGTTTNYYWGDHVDANYLYYWENTIDSGAPHARNVKSCPDKMLEFTGYCGNDFGLMHMLGNVWEMTADVYVSYYNDASTNVHVAVRNKTGSSIHTIRGGAWNGSAEFLRSTSRMINGPLDRSYSVGFRLVRIPQ